MLTEKDYCDYDTCVALEELGYPRYHYDNGGELDKILRMITLYNAQKWLREEKNIIVYPEKNRIGWFCTIHYNIGKVHRFKYSEEYYDSYEEAISEGIKEAVKILKDSRKQFLELENTEYDYGHNVKYEHEENT